MNELDFVHTLKRKFSFSKGKGIGDDASVIKSGDSYLLTTKDILIEDVHFNLSYFSQEELALKSLAINISDIAAMGGTPEYFYLGLGFPSRLAISFLDDFYQGLKKGCEKWKIELAGGDFSRSEKMFISITMMGIARKPVFRDGARKNNLIGITGSTGESALGLKLLSLSEENQYYINKHKFVSPEVSKGLFLADYVSSMIDISDGLLIDLKRILISSRKGAVVYYDKIPVSEQMRKLCGDYNFDEYELVLAGGEDYVLLFTLSPEQELRLRKTNLGYYIIGDINNNQDTIIVKHGDNLIEINSLGYDHFG